MTLKFDISRDVDYFVASWNSPLGQGGITTQAQTLPELISAISEAVQCHLDDDEAPPCVEFQLS